MVGTNGKPNEGDLKSLENKTEDQQKDHQGKVCLPREMQIYKMAATGRVDHSEEKTVVGAARYHGGYVYSPKLGGLMIKGSVYFVMPPGKYPGIRRENLPAAQAWLNEAAKEVLDSCPGIYDKFQGMAEIAFYEAPGLQWPEPRMKTFLKANAFLWALDDYCDNVLVRETKALDPEATFEVGRVVEDIFLGKYVEAEDISIERLGTVFESLCRLLFEVYEELRETVGKDYLARAIHMARSWRNLVLHCMTLVAPSGQMWDCDEMHMATRAESGAATLVEMLALLHDVCLSDEIRSNFLFRAAYNIGNLIGGISNDVICIKKEIEANEIPENFALRKAVKDGIPLKDAVEQVIRRMQEMALDYIRARKMLLEEWFPEDDQLRKFIGILDPFVDGQLYMYMVGQRWGPGRTYEPFLESKSL